MSEIRTGYIAAVLHDLGKRVLRDKQTATYGTWQSPRHPDLRALPGRLGSPPPFPHLCLDEAIVQLIASHHSGKGIPSGLERAGWALKFADRAHKTLYFAHGGGGGGIYGVNWHLPHYYPFWGKDQSWRPEKTRDFYQQTDGKPSILEELKSFGQEPSPEQVWRLSSERLSDFPDSTYLPVTSLHFHHQLVAALYVATMGSLSKPEMWSHDQRAVTADFRVEVRLTTITMPPEVLHYRLRDAQHVRKISDLLLADLHHFLVERHLTAGFQEGDFPRPEVNPFVFYGKDAVVLLHPAGSHQGIMDRCQRIADDRQAHFRVESLPVTFTSSQACRADQSYRVLIKGEPTVERRFVVPKIEHLATEPTGRCFLCGRPLDAAQVKQDPYREEDLCEVCHAIRLGFRQCAECRTYYPQGSVCPYGHAGDTHNDGGLGRWLYRLDDRSDDDRKTMLGVVALRIGCTPQQMAVESEVRLCQFRRDRAAAEDSPHWRKLLPNRTAAAIDWAKRGLLFMHGTGLGVLEYLQAVLEIEQRQEELLERMAEWLQACPEPMDTLPLDHFLYRSPLLTVMVVPEQALRPLYRELKAHLQELHLAYRLDVAITDPKLPLYYALQPVFDSVGAELEQARRGEAAAKAAAEFHRAASDEHNKLAPNKGWLGPWLAIPGGKQQWQVQTALIQVLGPVDDALRMAVQQDQPPEVSLRLLRGGQERTFGGRLADRLLAWKAVDDTAASQLGSLALLGDRLGRMGAPIKHRQTTLLLELAARASKMRIGPEGTRYLRELVRRQPETLLNGQLTAFLREIAASGRWQGMEEDDDLHAG